MPCNMAHASNVNEKKQCQAFLQKTAFFGENFTKKAARRPQTSRMLEKVAKMSKNMLEKVEWFL